ncbi:T9SS type A sorting domain-containing protein [Chitinophagaceae bacterium MMS25-I14]
MQKKILLTFASFAEKLKHFQVSSRGTFPGRLLCTAMLSLATCLPGMSSFAQVTFTAGNLTQTQNFNGMTANALPSGFAITSKSAGMASVDAVASSLGSSSTGCSYKFASSTDYAIGFLNSSSYGSPQSITATLQNNTGATITGFVITFNYEKYRTGSRAWDWTFFGSTNGSAFTSVPAGNQSYAADAANTTTYFPPQSVSMSVTISGLSIAQGSPYYLRWTLTGNGGSSNGQALGIDDVSITAVAAATCIAPSGLTAANVSATGADLSWGAVSGAAGYEYVIDQNSGSPAAAGTATTGTTYTASGLTQATAYYLHVRTACGGGSFSSWTTIPFTTATACTPPPATITPAGATTFCSGNSVVLNASTGTGLTYQWKLNGANISTATNSSYIANASGSYKVVVTNSSGCTDSSAATVVTVNTLPTAAITPAGATTFCAGNNVVLNANTGTGLTYQWTLNSANISNATNNTYTANASGNYKVVVTNGSGCTDSSLATPVTVNTLPTAAITPAGATTFCAGNNVVLNANTGTGLTYQWTLNGANINTATNSAYTANASGNYKVVVTNGSSCTDSSSATTITVNALPTVTITPATTTTFCAGNNVILNANTGTGLTYQWRLNSTNISNATNSSYTANASGSYKVVVTNGSGCTDSSAATVVTVNTLPTATITPAGATTFCAGNNVVLNANTGTGLTYQWRLNGANISNATNNAYTANASGSYKVVVTNASGCTDSSAATVVTVNALPAATITPASATTFCAGNNVVLNANTGTGLTYQWRLNNANVSNGTNTSYTANASGNYKVVVTTGSGCTDSSAATTVTVNALPAATVTPAGATTFCSGNSVSLIANTGVGLTYQWRHNGANISSATNNGYTANASGSYKVVVTNSNGCIDSSAATAITVNALPIATITPAGATTFCSGNSVVLNANTGAGLTYQWKLNGAAISNATNNGYTANASGSYKVVVTTGSGCTDSSSAMTVIVSALPAAIITAAGATTFCSGNSVMLNANTGTGLTYQWQHNGVDVPGATNSGYQANAAGTYVVSVSNSNCTATSPALTIAVNQILTPIVLYNGDTLYTSIGYSSYQWNMNNQPVPGATGYIYTPVKSGYYTVTVTDTNGCSAVSAINQLVHTAVTQVANNADIRLYPNPAATILHVDAPVKVQVMICSIEGKLVLQQEADKEINISNLAAGAYIVRIVSLDGKLLAIRKLLKSGE